MIKPSKEKAGWVAPGNYDGVHLGHRALLAAAKAGAQAQSLPVRVLTFTPHPMTVIARDRAPIPLTTIERRRELLVEQGVHDVVVQHFDAGFASLTPEAFVQHVLVEKLGARTVVIGEDFHFGRGRSGNVNTLTAFGEQMGFNVLRVPPVLVDSIPVSSSRIRDTLRSGDVVRASRLLGRMHDVDGTVVQGQKMGRTLGFPTANMAVDPVLLPKDGVYAVAVTRNDKSSSAVLRGVVNIGVRPTLAMGRSFEVHLLDFDGDLYDARLRVSFVSRIRDERKFDNVTELRRQIELDTRTARKIFEDFSEPPP